MQRCALLLGLIALVVTLGVLWQSEDFQQPSRVAETEVPLPSEVEQILFEMPADERDEVLRQFKQAQLDPRRVWVIELHEGFDDHDPFLFPTDQMYQVFPRAERRLR